MSTQKIQLTAGICAAKTSRHLPGHLCERFHDPKNVHVLFKALDTLQTHILHSRGFDAYVPAAFFSKCIPWVKG
jgi:hypothetical protein